MIIKRILFIAFLFPIGLIYAQTDFKTGYVITNSNDTLYGEIDYRGDLLMGQVCKFRMNKSDIVSYSPYDIAAYRFIDGKYFVSKEIDGKMVFLEFLIKGQMNIYYMRDGIGDHYFIEKDDMPLIEMPYEESIQKIDGKQYFYTTKAHFGILNYYMQDAPEIVQNRIGKLKQPEHKNLIKLAKEYHYAVCTNGEQCIIFEKKLPLVKVAVDVAGGMEYFRTDISSFTGGVLLNFWMPRTNEKLYFRTGLLYSKYKDTYKDMSQEHLKIYKIPLMIEYIYPKSVIRPKFAYGTIFCLIDKAQLRYRYDLIYTGLSLTKCMGGFNIQMNDHLSLSLEYHADFAHPAFGLIPRQFFSQSFLGGINFRF